MPIFFVNPAPMSGRRVVALGSSNNPAGRNWSSAANQAANPATTTSKGEKKMAVKKMSKRKGRRKGQTAKQRAASMRNLKKAWAKSGAKGRKKSKSKRKGKGKRRKGQTAKQRAASMRNLRKAWAKTGAKGGRKRSRKGKRTTKNRWGIRRARRARRSVKMIRKKGTRSAKKFANKWNLRTNPASITDALMKVAPIAVTFYGTKFVTGKLAEVGPVSSMLANLPGGPKLAGPVLNVAVLAGVHFGTKNAKAGGFLAQNRSAMMLGAAFAVLDSVVAALPAEFTSQIGVQSVGEYFPVSEYVPQSEYIAQSDYVAMDGLDPTDQSPRQLHSVWGVHGIEDELGSDYGSLTSTW